MTWRVELAERAVRDLRRLYRFMDAANSGAARDWFDGLEAAIFGLGENPDRCPATPENARLRQLLHRSKSYVYRVIYAVDNARQIVTVIHIRHGARQPFG